MIIISVYFAIFVLHFASSSWTNEFNNSTCDPYIECQNGGIGAKVADPHDCHIYYICVDSVGESVPSDISFTCPNNYYFSPLDGICMYESTPCKIECHNFCNLECTEDYQFVPDPEDCNKYYICRTGETNMEMYCPSNYPYFNGKICTNNRFQCCDSCIPFCSEFFTQIADPFDCQSFYICLETGLTDEVNHGKCPDGNHFDSATNVCVNGAECTSICGVSTTTVTTIKTSSTTGLNTGPAILL